MILRASSLPMLMACPGAAHGDTASTTDTEPAAVGTAAHEALAAIVHGTEPDIAGICYRLGVPEDEVRMLVSLGASMWSDGLATLYPEPQTELLLTADCGEWSLSGHIDVVSVAAGRARTGDWKSGRRDTDYRHQMMAYATLVMRDLPDVAAVVTELIWLRDRTVEGRTVTRRQSELWVAAVTERVVRWDGVYHPGDHCGYCPRRGGCVAATQAETVALAPWISGEFATAEARLGMMQPAEVIDLLERARMVARLSYRVQDVIRDWITEHGPLSDGSRELLLRPEERRSLDTARVWPILEDRGFGDAELSQIVDVSVSRLERLVASKAGKGYGASAVRDLREDLERAGAVTIEKYNKLSTRRTGT